MSYIGAEPIVSATRTITEVTATAGQTVFNANGGYTVGYIDVFLNGAQLQTVDFTATNGSSITLTEAAQVGDVLKLVAWGTFQSANLNGAGLIDGTVTQAKLGTNVAGTGPAFNAYLNSVQLISSTVNTKVTFDAENFDTNNNFASSRFTPTVAGYYQINATVTWTAAGTSTNLIYIFKNGSEFARGARIQAVIGDFVGLCASTVVYLNGSTDYVEIYAFTNGGLATFEAGPPTMFSSALVRTA